MSSIVLEATNVERFSLMHDDSRSTTGLLAAFAAACIVWAACSLVSDKQLLHRGQRSSVCIVGVATSYHVVSLYSRNNCFTWSLSCIQASVCSCVTMNWAFHVGDDIVGQHLLVNKSC